MAVHGCSLMLVLMFVLMFELALTPVIVIMLVFGSGVGMGDGCEKSWRMVGEGDGGSKTYMVPALQSTPIFYI